MATSLRELIVSVSADTTKYQREMDRASRMGAQYFRSVREGGDDANRAWNAQTAAARTHATAIEASSQAIGRYAAAAAGAFSVGTLVGMADDWGQISARIKLATQTQDEFTLAQGRLMEIANRTYRDYTEAADQFSGTAQSMREMGFAASETLDAAEALGLALVAGGSNAQRGASANDAWAKSMVQGKIATDQFQTLLLQTPRVIQALGEGLGKTTAELQAMAQEGQLTAQVVVPAITSQMGKLRDEVEAMPTTVQDAGTRFRNELRAWVGGQNEAFGATQVLVGGIEEVTENLNGLITIGGGAALGAMAGKMILMATSTAQAAVSFVQSRTAAIAEAGAVRDAIVVRPFAPDGTAGVAVSATYATAGADVPPVLVDLFDVQERSGGVRLYTWGWLEGTMRSADFAGVEIRYIADHVSAPDWDAMTPVGDTGYHTAAFEAVIPESGQWTFACRSRNTSGELSTGMRILQRTLGKNLGQSLSDITLEQVAQQQAIDAATETALLADLKAAKSLVLLGEEYDEATAYIAGDVVYLNGRMYRAIVEVEMGISPPDPAYWSDVGTVTEAQSSTSKAMSQLRVDVDEQGIEFASAIGQVESGLVSVTTAIKAVGGSGNLLIDSRFSDYGNSWPLIYSTLFVTPVLDVAGADWAIPRSPALSWYIPGTTVATVTNIYSSVPVTVTPNANYIASVYGAAHRGAVTIHLAFYNDAGSLVSEVAESPMMSEGSAQGGTSLDNWRRCVVSAVAPSTARTARIQLWHIVEAGRTEPFAWFTRPMLEQAAANQTQASPWSAGGMEQAASQTLTMDVNGFISGTQSLNDGKRSSFSILATVFRVVSSLTGMGMEWLDGYLRIWRGSAQLVLGHTFGSGDLVMWYGPNVGAGNCGRSNGLFYLDTDGGGYFGGALSAGALKNAVQTTNTATSGVELVNGPFSTNGKVRNVVVSYSRNQRRVKNAVGTDGFVAGAGSNTAVVQVYRKIGDAAETLWQTINVSGTVDIRNEPDTADVAISLWGGSVTVNDTSPSTSLVQYRAVLSAFTAQTVTHQSGSFDSQTVTQNLSIISVES